ncbi:MAG: 5'-3' exonuclease H3TH domain-containing protein [Candidatus Shapirobacteria bacterium]|jgi:DNA polymerase-1
MSHLVIIDAHAILHRAYHSIPPLTHNGEPVNAIYGFYSMLLSAIDTLKPSHLVVCVDSPGPTFRSSEFVGYRAKRQVPDHDLISQLPVLPQTLETSQIPFYAVGGFEADDLIATIVYKKKRFVRKITIITGDKDLMQLVDRRVNLFVPIRGLSETKIYGINEVKEKLGVLPTQVIDLKALMGDMSDNYPGVAGIGPKTATDLLTKYQNLDTIYFHLADISPTIKSKLETSREDAYLSQKLATLISNIPIKFRLKSARWNEDKITGLEAIFKDYNFKSLLSRLHKTHSQKPIKLVKNPNQSSLF